MDKNQVQMTGFQLIAYSGDALDHFYRAVEEAEEGRFEEAEKLVREGEEVLNEAHKAQTDLLAAEARMEDIPFSIILIHSQDHLMTTVMYEKVAKQLIEILKKQNNK